MTYGMSELPPEMQRQLMEQQQKGGASGDTLECGGVPPLVVPSDEPDGNQEAASDGTQAVASDGNQAAVAAAKPKRNALKHRPKVAAAPADELVSMNVRLSREAYDAVQALADEYGVSKAMVIRLALSGNMADYFGAIRYSDPAIEAEIRRTAARIGDASVEIGHQLRRIGKNYNQALRLAHTAAKQGGTAAAPEMDPDLINRAIVRYEAAAEKMEEALWRIQK